jgi:hypothetical protein
MARSIVVAVSSIAHEHFESDFTQPLLIVMGAILAAKVSVMNTAGWWFAKRHSIV